MFTRFIKINPENPEDKLIDKCVKIIKKGGSVVYPTETVYGLGVDVFNDKACAKVFDIKNRDKSKALIVHVNSIFEVKKVAKDIPEMAYKLMEKYWPGALTIVLKKSEIISDIVSQNENVGVRIPNNKIELKLLEKCGTCITGTSANISGKESIVDPKNAYKELKRRVNIVIDGGVCEMGEPSTIVDLSTGNIKLIREGSIKYSEILNFLGL